MDAKNSYYFIYELYFWEYWPGDCQIAVCIQSAIKLISHLKQNVS